VQEDGVNIEIMEHGHNVYICSLHYCYDRDIIVSRKKGLFQTTVFHVFVSQRNICGQNRHSQKKVLYIAKFKQVAIFMQIGMSMMRARYISNFERLKELVGRQ